MSIPLRVLILEDRPADAELMLHELRRAEFDPTWHCAGSEAEYLARLSPELDVILADYRLPQFDALRALRHLQERKLNIPFIIVTGTLGDELAAECVKQGAVDYVLKDRLARLGLAVKRALEEKRLREREELVRQERLDLLIQLSQQMGALVEASLKLITERSLERAMQNVTEVARTVLCARYVALGVFREDGAGLRHFFTAGMDYATKAAIGPPPTGKGILGIPIKEGRPLRIRDLSSHPRAGGFPPHHPPMRSFLGVPILVRGKAYGNLYATEKQGAEEFSEADEQVALMLAAQAGIVIENADLFEHLQQLAQELEERVEERTRALRAAQAELVEKERLAMMGQLAGGMAHELRNPLGVIKNSVYYLKMVLPEQEKTRKHLQILEREVGTADRIVTNLLDFARDKPPVRVPSDLSALVREILERTPVSENVDVVAHLAADLLPVSVDPLQVAQVLGNLVMNAAQAMPEGGTLTVEAAPAEGGVLVTVSDTGVGIPPENLGKIFQPLFTTKAKGIGLGLAVAKRFAEANGGMITVESTPGRGSRFVVRFVRSRKEE